MTEKEKSKKLLWIIAILAIISIVFTFVKTVIWGDFDIIESELMENTEEVVDTEINTTPEASLDGSETQEEVLGEKIELI